MHPLIRARRVGLVRGRAAGGAGRLPGGGRSIVPDRPDVPRPRLVAGNEQQLQRRSLARSLAIGDHRQWQGQRSAAGRMTSSLSIRRDNPSCRISRSHPPRPCYTACWPKMPKSVPSCIRIRCGPRILSDLYAEQGGLVIEDYEMLKGLGGHHDASTSRVGADFRQFPGHSRDWPANVRQRLQTPHARSSPRLPAATAWPVHLGPEPVRRQTARRDL